MTWTVEYDKDAFRKLDKPVAASNVHYIDDVATLDDPRSRRQGLTGNLAGLWRYRIGDYRVICDLHEEALIIVTLDLGHRSNIYM